MPSVRLLLALPLLAFLAQTPAPAGGAPEEAILAAIDRGRTAFTAGKDQEAVEQLQKAIGLIQERAIQGLAAFLPARDESLWELDEVQTVTGNWGSGETSFQWSQVSRRYTQKTPEAGAEVTVMITNSPPLLEAQQGIVLMLKDPNMRKMMAQGGQEIEFIEEGGWVGMVTAEGDGCDAMLFHQKVMVQIQARQGGSELVREFWSAMNRSGLAGAAK